MAGNSIALLLPIFPLQVLSAPLVDHAVASTVFFNSSTLVNGSAQNFTIGVKAGTVSASGFSVILIVVTYAVLIERAGYLVSTAKIPFTPLKKNLANLLALTWPDEGDKPDLPKQSDWVKGEQVSWGRRFVNWVKSTFKPKKVQTVIEQSAIRLLYLGRMQGEGNTRVAKGLRQCSATPNPKEPIYDHPLWVTSSSPGTRSAVQLMIWEWVSIWLMLITLINTLLYNGFITGHRTGDSWPRLAVVIAYTASLLFHVYYIWRSFRKSMTLAVSSAAWTMLHRANFAVVEESMVNSYLKDNKKPLEFTEVGKSSPGASYAPSKVDATLANHLRSTPAEENAERQKELDAALKDIRSMQDLEFENVLEAADSALGKIRFNSAVMMSISVATAFSTWTPKILVDNTSTQIGSLSLLSSVSLGMGAMFSSALHMSTLNSSVEQILSKKEVVISGKALEYFKHRRPKQEIHGTGFASKSPPPCPVTFSHLFGALTHMGRILVVLFGPAFALLPSQKDADRTSSDTSFEFDITVRLQSITFTTSPTTQHKTDAVNGESLDTINVCYRQTNKNEKFWPRIKQDSTNGVYPDSESTLGGGANEDHLLV